MRVNGISNVIATNKYYSTLVGINHTKPLEYDTFVCSNPSFSAAVKLNSNPAVFAQKRARLLKQIESLLEEMPPDLTNAEFLTNIFQRAANHARAILHRQQVIMEEIKGVLASNQFTDKQKYDIVGRLKKEIKRLGKGKVPEHMMLKAPDPKAEKYDYILLNKFKTAILNEDYNLEAIFNAHYAELAGIKTLDELQDKYPKISVPQNPINAIAEKLAASVTRDFYEEFDVLYEAEELEKATDYSMDYVYIMCKKNSWAFGKLADVMANILPVPTFQLMVQKYKRMRAMDTFSLAPEFRKNKTVQFSKDDVALFGVDYEDYVLHVIKEQYLKGARLKDIVYDDGEKTVKVGELRDSAYKFEKVSEKIKAIISDARVLFAAQRDYDNFNQEQFRERLNFYAAREIGDDEAIFEHILKFDSAKLNSEDIEELKKFLLELDLVQDGKQTLENAIESIKSQKLSPKGTEKFNEQQRLNAEKALKEMQKRASQLRKAKDEFDEAMNILYSNNMVSTATQLSQYRPESLDIKATTKAKFIVETILKCADENGKIPNKQKLETTFVRWDTYNYYRQKDKQSPIFQEAINFAKQPDGSHNIDLAGQYLINYEIVENYPESLQYFQNPSLLQKIMERAGEDKELALESLIKYDTYKSDIDKNKITEILKLFNPKGNIDKILLKEIIEQDYINVDTTDYINFNEGATKIAQKVVIASQAKKQIFEKYMFPNCISYLQWFEDSMTSVASSTGASGIKQIGKNDQSLLYKMELKLVGVPDRLFSSKNDYCFDIYSDRGLH